MAKSNATTFSLVALLLAGLPGCTGGERTQETRERRETIERGEVPSITGLPERTARRVLADVVQTGLLSSDTPKGRLHLHFPADAVETLFPRLFPET